MLEKTIEKKVCDYAKAKGIINYKFTSPSSRSVCDRIMIGDGYVFFIEFKREGEKPTTLQARHHQMLASKKIAVYVIDNVKTGMEIIDYELSNKGAKHHRDAVRYVDSD